MPVCPIRLGQRVAFNRCLLAGQTAAEYEPGGKAAQEIDSLLKWASETVGLSTGAKERKSTRTKGGKNPRATVEAA
jgi:chromosome partitioning protein